MKKIVYTLIFTALTVAQTFAQTVAPVVVGGSEKGDTNATMEILSQKGTKGFMPPRLTTTQITALGSNLNTASNGLTVFNTDTNCLQYWKGTKWSDCSTYSNAELTVTCASSTIKGTYNIDKQVTDNEFMEVRVDVTKAGPFVFYSDSNNGVRFYLSTILNVGNGQLIAVPAVGTPKAAGSFTYNLFDQSGNAICAGNANFKTTVVDNTAAITVKCDEATLMDELIEGNVANNQRLKLKIEVSKPGNYYIKTNTVNGLWFEGSGVLSLGSTEVILNARGTISAAAGDGGRTFNLLDKNNASLQGGCSVKIYVMASKAVLTLDCSSVILEGGLKGSYYPGYVFTDQDKLKVKVNVTRTGPVNIYTPKTYPIAFSYTGTIDKLGVQELVLTPVSKTVDFTEAANMMSYSIQFYNFNNNTNLGSSCTPGASTFLMYGFLSKLTLNPEIDQLQNGQYIFDTLTIYQPVSAGFTFRANYNFTVQGLYALKGTANGITVEAINQTPVVPGPATMTFKMTGSLISAGTTLFPIYDMISGQLVGAFNITFKNINGGGM
jgi:predicted 3-demethylubiquinone-9 3-methyltransferase (glyoxalase superfamily)